MNRRSPEYWGKTWYRRALAFFVYGLITTAFIWFVFSNFSPDDHARWLKQGSYLVVAPMLAVFGVLATERVRIRMARSIQRTIPIRFIDRLVRIVRR